MRQLVSYFTLAILLCNVDFFFGFEVESFGADEYCIVVIDTTTVQECRFYRRNDHFMSLVFQNGTFNLRPHPGKDINGWGSSWYAQPFLPGAVLKYTNVDTILANDSGIYIKATGNVSRHTFSTYGTWWMQITFEYDSSAKKIMGFGTYSIQLDNVLDNNTRDLNLYRIASNFLYDVPLLSGGIGNTGDMDSALVDGRSFANYGWYPPRRLSHFPTDIKSDSLAIDVKGQFNEVNTKAMGFDSISAAYKPSMKVTLLNVNDPPIDVFFGAIYDTSDGKGRAFWEDNIGITPLVKNRTVTDLLFKVYFESKALPNDGSLPDTAVTTRPPNCVDILVDKGTVVEARSSKIVRRTQLAQNYPNPFNPETLIEYELSKFSSVELIIYNQLGQKVRTLINTAQHPGFHRIQWDGRNNNGTLVSSGTYFYQLNVDGFTQIRKMILLR